MSNKGFAKTANGAQAAPSISNHAELMEYIKKHNRHTLKISLINEQVGEEFWEGSSITFLNEDNAISHLWVLNQFLELLTKEENKRWGYTHTTDEVVNNIIDPIRSVLKGDWTEYRSA